MFSKACEYGIRAVVFIAAKSAKDERSSIADIAEAIASPEAFTAKICQKLAKENLIGSKKGPTGGFYIEKNSQLKLIDIVRAIDGDDIFTGCALGLQQCNSKNPCPLHHQFVAMRTDLRKMCEQTLIINLGESLQSGTYLKTIIHGQQTSETP